MTHMWRPALRQPSAGPGIGDLASRALVAGLYLLLVRSVLADFLETGRMSALPLMASELLVVVFTLLRRRATVVDRSPASVVVTAISAAGPLLVRAGGAASGIPDFVTTVASTIGLAVIMAGKLSLGRSFGLVPANRGIVARGMYGIVRHPIYAGYLLTHAAFAVAMPQPWNLAVLAIADGALIARALREERLLVADEEYRMYCRRVAWHFVPGVF